MEESVSILKVDTGEAIKSVNDLKENIKLLKSNLGDLTIGSQAYQNTLEELTINQNALKDAMHGTSASLEAVVAAASSANVEFDEQNKLINANAISYNELVHTMAALKEEWRSTSDEARRAELSAQIDSINYQLKAMDASVGNFSRNVGNYESGVSGLVAKFDSWGETLKNMPPTLGAAKESMGKVGETMKLIGKQPILGIIGLLAPIIVKITESLKGNKTAMDAVKKLMDSFQPIMDLLQKGLDKIAGLFAQVVDWFLEFVLQSEGMKKVVSVIAGVGNSILQYLLTPVKTIVEAFKGLGNILKDVFTGNFKDVKKHAKEAGEGIANAWKEGYSFKQNFNEGKQFGSEFIAGLKDNKKEAESAGEEIGKEVAKGIEKGLKLADANAALQKGEAKKNERAERLKKEQEELADIVDAEWADMEAEMESYFAQEGLLLAESMVASYNARKEKEEYAKSLVNNTMMVADATSGLLSSLADMYESDEKNAEKNAKKIKGLRIASATIDMLNGAITAFTSAQSIPPPFGQIIGAANAAAVIAMGVANINKMKSTNPTGGAAASATPVVVSPPSVDTSMQSVRNVTSASEEERLNRMASSQRVYILQSDIEAAGDQSKVQVAESSF